MVKRLVLGKVLCCCCLVVLFTVLSFNGNTQNKAENLYECCICLLVYSGLLFFFLRTSTFACACSFACASSFARACVRSYVYLCVCGGGAEEDKISEKENERLCANYARYLTREAIGGRKVKMKNGFPIILFLYFGRRVLDL